MARPRLDLSPELPEVRSEDFNLFYKPETEPLPAGLEKFSRSLSAFVSDGLVDQYVLQEKKKKKERCSPTTHSNNIPKHLSSLCFLVNLTSSTSNSSKGTSLRPHFLQLIGR